MTNKVEQINIYVTIYSERKMSMNKITIKDLKELSKIEERKFIINLEELKNTDKKSALYFLSGMVFNKGTLKKINANEYLVKCD